MVGELTKSSFLESTLELVGPYMTLNGKKFQLKLRQIFFNFLHILSTSLFVHLMPRLLPSVLLMLAGVSHRSG